MKNLPVQEHKKESSLKKVGKSLGSMFKRLFVQDKRALSVLEEEALQTPTQTVIKNFFRNKLGVVGIIGFIAILAFSFVGSRLVPINLSYQETLLRNLRPGTNYLKFPKELEKEGVLQIDSGVSFSIALSKKGKVYIWGQQPIQIVKNMSTSIFDIPEEVKNSQVTHVAAGDRHVLAVTADGRLFGWGNNNHGQAIPREPIDFAGRKVVGLHADDSYSAILFDDGTLEVWGSAAAAQMRFVPSEYHGRIKKIIPQSQNILMLLDDGTVGVNGAPGGALTKIPEELQDGSVKVVDIAAANRAGLALDDKGNLYLWGSREHGLQDIPEFEGTPVALISGRNNLGALLDNGQVVYWGANQLKQLELPNSMANAKIVEVFGRTFQNYGIDENGKIHAWGNKGFIFGSDEFGRDVFTRLIHGGKISLTVGAISVVISVIIALIVGMPSGFFGGWVDHALMRLADFVMTIPVLPIAITLSVIVAGKVPEMYRIFMLMVIIGILGWPGLARLVRAQILLEREKDFVLAARALGVKRKNIIVRHILPNVFNLVLVNITLGYANALLLEAAYSFLGFGVQAPTPSWGNMLQNAQSSAVLEYWWWRWVIPGLFVLFAALSINLVGDALRDALDPKANEK